MYISIYRFDDAPQEWRGLSTNGGDEDWLAFIPNGFSSHPEELPFMRWGVLGNFVDEYNIPGGKIFIGSHA